MVKAYPKHPTFRNMSYLPPDVTGYANIATAGQRYALYFPDHEPGYYGWVGGYPTYLFLILTNFTASEGSWADSTNKDIDGGGVAPNESGLLWQHVDRGFVVAMAQQTPTVNGASYPTEGYFREPGHTSGEYESKVAPISEKDAIHAIQNIRFNRRIFGLNGRVVVSGTSAGSVSASWLVFGPNRRGELGSGGQYNESTRPNAFIARNSLIPSWKIMDQTIAGSHFENASSPGTLATALTQVTAATLRGHEIISYCPWWGSGSGASVPTFFHAAPPAAPLGTATGVPFGTGVETNVHNTLFGVLCKTQLPDFKVYSNAVAQGGTLAAPSVGNPRGGALYPLLDGTIEDLDALGAAGNNDGDAVKFSVDNVMRDELDIRRGSAAWRYSGAVTTTARQVVPREATGRTRFLRIICTDAVNALRIGSRFDTLAEYVYPDGIGVVIRTSEALYARSDAATPSGFVIDEFYEG